MAADIKRFHAAIAGKKVYLIGEFGFIPVSGVEKVLEAVISEGLPGALVWSLRFRNHDGGFYWHTEGASGNAVKAYHYPGFSTGQAYQETELLQLLRRKAFEISGRTPLGSKPPSPPTLLPIRSVAAISWQGSVGATSYDVERATTSTGPWTVAGANVDETFAQYRPLFCDAQAEAGHSYYYRVLARSDAGLSAPSNVIGPVRVEDTVLVDELSSFASIRDRGGELTLATANPRPYKEDAHRLRGTEGSWLTYRVAQPLRLVRVLAFMEAEQKDLEFYLSSDGQRFNLVKPKVRPLPTAVNPYGYKLPIEYEIGSPDSNQYFIKIVFKTATQLSRVELHSAK
jgi:hypothetical protein